MKFSNLPYTPERWSLADLFPSPDGPEMKATFADVEAKVADFEGKRSLLTPDIDQETFMGFVRLGEQITRLIYRIYAFAGLWFSEDTQNQAAQNLQARVDQFVAGIENRTLFFGLWWKALDEAAAARLMENTGDYHYWLEEMRHFKPHTLSEPEEKIVNIKNTTGVSALTTLYDTLTNRYVFKITVDGEEKELTRDSLMVYVRKHDPGLRAAAYQEQYRVYGQDGAILGMMYQNLVRDWRNEQIDLRHFAGPISARNLANDIPDEVVDTLFEVSKRNAPIFQRFFRLKARWLGMDRLRRYDIYAPVVKSDKTYAFDVATGMVLDSFHRFDPRLATLAQRLFAEKHVDSEVRKGKRGGAFCWSVNPGLTPWMQLNYQGRADDVLTLAHELGHAIHAMLAAKHTQYTFHSSLPLAETASTFGEMMVEAVSAKWTMPMLP